MQQPRGIIITSPSGRSGKTLVSAGLAGSILSIGLDVEAVKPYQFSSEFDDIKYLVQVTKRVPYYDTIKLESWKNTNNNTWNQLLKICRNFAYPVILESPGCLSTPLCYDEEILDCTDLSTTLNWPIILTIDASNKPYEVTAQALAFLRHKNIIPLGFIFTCSDNEISYEEVEEIANMLIINYGSSCLGIIPYSPSISTGDIKQGNNIKLTQQYVDLHPVQNALDLVLIG